MALKSFALTTVARFKTFAGVTTSDDDSLLEILVNAVTEFVENYCGRRFKETAYSNIEIDSDGSNVLILPNYPVDSAATFTLQERASTENDDDWDTVDADDYFVNYDSGIIQKAARSRWLIGHKAYRVSYTAGYDFDNSSTFLADTEAGDVELAVWKIVNTVYRRRKSEEGIASERIADYAVSYQAALLESPDVRAILDKYAGVAVGGGINPQVY